MYSQKTIQNLKPAWYLELSKNEKKRLQDELIQRRKELWKQKPVAISTGSLLVAKENISGKSKYVIGGYSVTKGKKYRAIGYFATLVTTIYDSSWHEFVTIKNNNGFTVKMNLSKFDHVGN